MFLLVPAHPGFPGQIPQSRKTVVCVCKHGCTVNDVFCRYPSAGSYSVVLSALSVKYPFLLDADGTMVRLFSVSTFQQYGCWAVS